MSENYNPQDGAPNPYGNPNPYLGSTSPQQPVYFDPNHNPNAYPPGFATTGEPGTGKSQYLYPAYAQGRNLGAVSQKEANTKATIALVLGIVSFFFLGLILSIPGYFVAKQAELANGENAKVARIVNLVSIWVSVLIGLFFILLFALGLAGAHSTR
jgi:hypothetical protein